MATEQYEEEKVMSKLRTWVILVTFSASILAWAMLLMTFVRTIPRQWDFGTLPDTPGLSVYSTTEPPAVAKPPLQIPPLPEREPEKASTGSDSSSARNSEAGGDH